MRVSTILCSYGFANIGPCSHISSSGGGPARRAKEEDGQSGMRLLDPSLQAEAIHASGHLGLAENDSDVEARCFEHDKSFISVGCFVDGIGSLSGRESEELAREY